MKSTESHTKKSYKPFADRRVIKILETVGEDSKGKLQFAPTKNYQYIILLYS